MVDVELAATKLNEAMVNVSKPNTTTAEKKQILAAALPKLKTLSRAWEQMTTSLQETVLSAGTLGTLATNDANMYVRDFPFNSTATQLLAAGMNVARSGKGFRAVRSGQKRNAMKIDRRV